jgi:DNA-directed RNA polymerase subunit H (RpoH/RPB5)
MLHNNYTNILYSDEELRILVLENICKMILTRGYMDIKKYTDNKTNKLNTTLFLPFIGTYNDNSVYLIPLDKPYKNEREKSTKEFKGDTIIVKLISQSVKDVSNSHVLNDFYNSYKPYHKIIVFDDITDKVYNTISRKHNAEVFSKNSLLIDIMSHVCAPNSCSFVSHEDMKHIINPKFAKIHENDPLCRYYNGKKGMIMRIVSSSMNNVQDVRYRTVIGSTSLFYN